MRYSGRLFIVVILAILSLTGCQSSKKRVLVVHSYSFDYSGYSEYNDLIAKCFRKQGVRTELSFFYLDCERYNEKEEINRMNHFLDSIAGWHPDIILLNDDQATLYSWIVR